MSDSNWKEFKLFLIVVLCTVFLGEFIEVWYESPVVDCWVVRNPDGFVRRASIFTTLCQCVGCTVLAIIGKSIVAVLSVTLKILMVIRSVLLFIVQVCKALCWALKEFLERFGDR